MDSRQHAASVHTKRLVIIRRLGYALLGFLVLVTLLLQVALTRRQNSGGTTCTARFGSAQDSLGPPPDTTGTAQHVCILFEANEFRNISADAVSALHKAISNAAFPPAGASKNKSPLAFTLFIGVQMTQDYAKLPPKNGPGNEPNVEVVPVYGLESRPIATANFLTRHIVTSPTQCSHYLVLSQGFVPDTMPQGWMHSTVLTIDKTRRQSRCSKLAAAWIEPGMMLVTRAHVGMLFSRVFALDKFEMRGPWLQALYAALEFPILQVDARGNIVELQNNPGAQDGFEVQNARKWAEYSLTTAREWLATNLRRC